MNDVEVSAEGIETPEWLGRAADFARVTLGRIEKDNWELSLLFCDDAFNPRPQPSSTARRMRRPMSFLSSRGIPSVTRRGANASSRAISSFRSPGWRVTRPISRVSEDEELKRLLVHGILHLAGHDHATSDLLEPMLRLQEELLSGLSAERIL